jgi:hypothetical protein
VSRIRPWSRHYLDVWHERAGDPRFPLWFRVAALAYGGHDATGHARFKPGELGLILGTLDASTGEWRSLHKANVQRVIARAVEFGLLAPESGSLCLVVPQHAIHGGVGGNGNVVCPLHGRKGRTSKSSSDSLPPVGKSSSDLPGSRSVTYSQASDLRKRDRSLDSVLGISAPSPGRAS